MSQVGGGVVCPRSGGYPIPGQGGTPSQVQGGTLSQVWGGTCPRSGGYPVPVPPCPDLGWGTPLARPGIGYSPLARPGMGSPPRPDLGWGTPPRPDWGTPPPTRCGLTNKLKTVPSPILRMRAVIKQTSLSYDYLATNKLTVIFWNKRKPVWIFNHFSLFSPNFV